MIRLTTKSLTRTAIIAVVYYVVTVAVPALSYGVLQFRVGEALTLMPLVFPESVIGLTLGCFLANITSPFGWPDMLFGSLATMLAGVLTAIIGRRLKTDKLVVKCLIGALPPILINAFMLPLVWFLFGLEQLYWLNVALMLATQSGTIIVIGTSIILGLDKAKLLQKTKLY
ncbi:MAG: QueT transporter family protein [Clostridia bacterium]|nr:QueT transporter family protein [Clostridia bacterium]